MSPLRCPTCNSAYRWTGRAYYCGKCQKFAIAKATGNAA